MADMDVEAVLASLSLTEKVDLLAGADFWHTTPLPQHGIFSVRTTDGPHHVRGARFFNGTPTAAIPCSPALAATFDTELVEEIGRLLGAECRAKGCHVLLGPSLNLIRNPLAGRGYESFSEDPLVCGLLGAAYCRGLQSDGVMATAKHYVCHDQEQDNLANSVVVTEKALRELYLLPFMLAVKHGQPACVMTAQHRVNGTHVSEHKHLIQDVLREEWGYDGLVMSDWFGVYSVTDAFEAGVDVEMPGPSRFRGRALAHAVACNRTPARLLDDRARAVLRFVKRAAASGIPADAPEAELDLPEHRALLRRAAADAAVLLKNEGGVLPFSRDRHVAVIGPNAEGAAYRGGHSAHLVPYTPVASPLDAIRAASTAPVGYAVGAHNHKALPILGPQLTNARGGRGFDMLIYDQAPGTPGRRCLDRLELVNASGFFMNYRHPGGVLSAFWHIEISGAFVPPATGEYDFSVTVQGAADLRVDGELVVDNTTHQTPGPSFFGGGTVEEKGSIRLEAGREYQVLCHWCTKPVLVNPATVSFGPGGIRLGCAQKLDPDAAVDAAVALATQHEQVVVFAGLTGEWETEGSDRRDMAMPPPVERLVRAVLRANSRAVICLHSALPLDVGAWVDDAPAVVQAWYGGSEHGNAIADVLYGDVNPSGKLPMTFPMRLQDNPTYINRRSESKRLLYGEDIYVGYRFYDEVDRQVRFPFGHGLSYTTFRFSALDVTMVGDDNLSIAVSVANTGNREGAEVVQVYVSKPVTAQGRPPKELKAFRKVKLQPAEERRVELAVDLKYATACWDENEDSWLCEAGQYNVLVGSSSRANFLIDSFSLEKSWWWKGL